MKQNKKKYEKPQMQVYELPNRQQLLQASARLYDTETTEQW